MTFNDHATQFAGWPVVEYQPGEPLANPGQSAIALRLTYDEMEEGADLTERLADLLSHDQADRIPAIVIGVWSGEMFETSPAPIVEALVAAAGRLASLKGLFLGDVIFEENEVSWMNLCDVSPLWSAFPQLEHFQVRGANELSLGELAHSRLKSLVIESGGLPKSVLEELAAADLPALEHLELYLGDDGYGFDGAASDVAPILAAGKFPRLKTLGLRDSVVADEVAKVVVQSGILDRIEVLDMSLGVMTDAGAETLLAAPSIRKLQRLDLHRNYISPAVAAKFSALGIEVDLTRQEDPNEEYRYPAIGE